MASSVAYALCVVLCICSLQTAVLAKKEKIAFTLYAHEIRGGPNATLLPAAGTGQGNFSAVGWGSFLTFENFLKEGPAFSSKTLGRITGWGALTTKGGLSAGGIQVFSKWWWSDGSSLTLVGTLSYPTAPWEVSVVAGTGRYRGYGGYALAQPELSTTLAPLFVYKWEFHLYQLFKAD